MRQETFQKACELQSLIRNLKENRDTLSNRIHMHRHTNNEKYHELTLDIEREIVKFIKLTFDKHIEKYENEFEQL